MRQRIPVSIDILEAYRFWLSAAQRNAGHGYAEKTIKRYIASLQFVDANLGNFAIDFKRAHITEIVDYYEFANIERRIRQSEYFKSFNANQFDGKCVNLNGTGSGDPSATLALYGEFLREGVVNVSSLVSSYEEEFGQWYLQYQCHGENKTETNSTVRHYCTGLKALSQPLGEKDTQKWCGIYEYLLGQMPDRPVFQVGDIGEFERIYGTFGSVLSGVRPEGIDKRRFDECREYLKGSRTSTTLNDHGNLSAAFNAYRKFLLWREKQDESDAVDELSNVDRLTVALKLFAERRLEEDWIALLKRDGYEGIRVRYEGMNPETLRNMTAAEFDVWANKELWALQHYRCKQTFDKLTDEQKTACARFVAAVKKNVQPVTSYFPTTTNCPEGVGPVVATELLMKFHPQDYMGYSALMLDGMKALKLLEVDPQYDTAIGYQKTMGIASQILEKMFAMKLTQSFDDEKYIKPDYITVNEFLWWVKTHQDLIKEEIMKRNQIKAEPEKLKTDGKKNLSDLIAGGPDSLMTMLTAALLAKPFAILAGASGTGKSRMVKKLAYMTCNADQLRSEKDETPGNYCMVAVKPNWHDSSELLGYRSAISESHEYITPDFIKFILRAHAFPKTPFFVCLDEMNLAPVEQYFAEFLSACESIRKNKEGEWVSDPLIQPGEFDKNVANLAPDYSLPDACIKRINERGLYIPHNLFVVGTVNMDDTTHQFSRKVLDRAMTLTMDDVDFGTLQDAQYEKLTNDLLMNGDDIKKFIDRGEFEGKDLEKDFKDKLGDLQTALKESPFAIGYRFAIESVLYRKALALLGIETAALDATAADHMALMKILPRITGTLEERDTVLKNLADFFGALGEHKQSGDRLEKMKTAARQNGDYISFWP